MRVFTRGTRTTVGKVSIPRSLILAINVLTVFDRVRLLRPLVAVKESKHVEISLPEAGFKAYR